jgi:protein-tyrosine sulfotransferase
MVHLPAGSAGGGAGPVFVLCMGRSGSTLLRFLLDAHPELACPPETSLPALCGQLAVVWSLIEGAPLAPDRGDIPPQVPEAAIAGIRHTADMMTGSYLARRGKKRFCDKSLGSARFADLLARVYPEARFVCLYRHPMDMIGSGLEACPWGLNGYGFGPYIAESPGNAVLALGRYWLENATAIAGFEEGHPGQCHRVRYEDLVADPEQVAQQIFAFIGVAPAPGITRACFTAERERFGPADHKIWATSQITADSVGKGESVPAGLIPPPVTAAINELAGKLGYRPVAEDWGTPGMPADPRLPDTIGPRAQLSAPPHDGSAEAPMLAERLRAGLEHVGGQAVGRWAPATPGAFLVVSRAHGVAGDEARWLVDPDARTVTPAGSDDDEGAGWNILGSPEAWSAVLSGRTNLHTALRRCELRYCSDEQDSPFGAETRIAMLADLLGLCSWQSGSETADPDPVPAPTAAGS